MFDAPCTSGCRNSSFLSSHRLCFIIVLDYAIFVFRLPVYIPGYSSSHFSYFRAHPSYHDCDRCNFQCGECHFKTAYKANLKRHMKFHMAAKSKMYVCPGCGKRLGSLGTLTGQVKQRHPAKALAIDKTFRIPDSVYFHFCEFYQMAFSTSDVKERHFKYVHADITQKDLRDYAISKQRESIRTTNILVIEAICFALSARKPSNLIQYYNVIRIYTEVMPMSLKGLKLSGSISRPTASAAIKN